MDTFARLIVVVILAAFYSPSHSATYTPDFGELKSIDGDLHITRGNGTTSLMYPDAGLSKSIDVSTSKGNFPVPVEKSFPVIPAKVGKAAVRFLKVLPAVSTAVALYDLACSEGGVCFDQDTDSFTSSDPVPDGYPLTTAQGFWHEYYESSYRGPTPESVCNLKAFKQSFTIYWMQLEFTGLRTVTGQPYSYNCTYLDNHVSPAETIYRGNLKRSGVGCVAGYLLVAGVCTYQVSTHSTTQQDWDNAETKLSSKPSLTANALYDSGAPVPVDASTQSAPVTQQIAQTSTQTQDAQGNVTGTQVATTSVKVEDTSTASNVTYNVTETTTITNYNENNEITSTQTSTSDNQPPEPPKPPEPEDVTMNHGGVPEIPLLTQVIDVQEELDNNQQTPWSAGTCPADIDVGIYGLEFSFAPFCTFAEGLRPVVLTLGAFLSFYILAGFKFD